MFKFCNKCKIEKSLESFHLKPKGKFGRQPVCKECLEFRKNAHKYAEVTGNKVCKSCKNLLPVEDFYFKSGGKYNRTARCRTCLKNEYKYLPIQVKKRFHAIKRKNIEENYEEYRRKNRIYREKNKERIQLWVKQNFLPYGHTRRARELMAEGKFTIKEFKQLCQNFEDCCVKCGRNDNKLTADHVVPLSKGGSNYISNIQPLCGSCNSSKGTKTIDYRPLFYCGVVDHA